MVSNSVEVKVFLTDHMHTRSRIDHKLSLLWLSCWGTRENPLCMREECSSVVRFELVYIVGKIPSLALSTPLLSSSLFVGPILEFCSVGTSLMSRFDLFFPSDGPFFSRILGWRGVDLSEPYFSNWSQVCLHRVSRVLFRSLRIEWIRFSWYTTQLWYAFLQLPQHSCLHFLFFLGSGLSSAFYLVVHQPCNEETDTCLLTYNPFLLCKIGTWANANLHKAFACKYPSDNIYTIFEEWTHGYCCLGYFSSSTHFYLVKGLAPKVWRLCVLVLAHDLGYRGGNCNGHLANTGLFLSTGNIYLFLLQRQWFPFDSLSRLQIQFSHAWRQSFVNGVSDQNIFSPWCSTFDS